MKLFSKFSANWTKLKLKKYEIFRNTAASSRKFRKRGGDGEVADFNQAGLSGGRSRFRFCERIGPRILPLPSLPLGNYTDQTRKLPDIASRFVTFRRRIFVDFHLSNLHTRYSPPIIPPIFAGRAKMAINGKERIIFFFRVESHFSSVLTNRHRETRDPDAESLALLAFIRFLINAIDYASHARKN